MMTSGGESPQTTRQVSSFLGHSMSLNMDLDTQNDIRLGPQSQEHWAVRYEAMSLCGTLDLLCRKGSSRLSTCCLCFYLQAFGEDIAILAGDALLSLSFEYIARETRHVAPERVVRVSYLSLMLVAVLHAFQKSV